MSFVLLFFSARLENEFLYEGHKQKIKKTEEKRDDQGEGNHEHRERDGLFFRRPVYMAHFRSCFFEIFGYFHAFDFPLKKPLAGRSMASSIYPLEIEVNPCAKPTARTVLAVGYPHQRASAHPKTHCAVLYPAHQILHTV